VNKSRGQPKRIREAQTQYEAKKRPKTAGPRPMASGELSADWQWVQAHRAQLEEQYAGRWIAVSNKKVAGAGIKLSTALKQAKLAGAVDPFVTAFKPTRFRKQPQVPQWL